MKRSSQPYRAIQRSLVIGSYLLLAISNGTAQEFVAQNAATYATCSGSFHDSGGSANPYADNETIVTTLCPTGGPGAGPFTSITFTQWQLAAGAGDTLKIFEGITATGLPLIIAGASTPLVGQSFASVGVSGCLTFQWRSNGAGVAAGWSALITTGPDAGQDEAITVCSSGASFNLFDELGGTPDAGGSWTDPLGAAHSGVFVPGTSIAGPYQYSVLGVSPCAAASATVTVAVNAARMAGTSASTNVCGNIAPFNMQARLGGTPEPGGSWVDPLGQAHPLSFDPATGQAGIYTYTLIGAAPCPNASAALTIAIQAAPSAGIGSTVTLCNTSASADLFVALGGVPQSGGAWVGPNGPHSGTFDPAVDQAGVYIYIVAGTPPCTADSATVDVVLNQQPIAGTSGAITVCSNDPSFSLFGVLGGSPNTGGAWTGPLGNPRSATYTPGISLPGTYTYTLLGAPPCVVATSTVLVTQVAAPVAGSSATITVCSDEAPFQLLTRLGGTPDTTGSWTGPSGPFGPSFDPSADPGGLYQYIVSGNGPCADATATLTIVVRTAPNAGVDTTVTVCSTDGVLSLFSALAGTPDAGGSWVGPDALPHSGTFTPGVSLVGPYTYTVTGLSPCAPAVATVTVIQNEAPDAGANASLIRCSVDAPFSLVDELGGAPDTGGSWSGPDGPHGAEFIPGTDTAGAYTYTVAGLVPCLAASATLNVSISQAPRAGLDGDTTLCSNAAAFDLLLSLGGSPDLNGTWSDPDGAVHSGQFDPGTDQQGTYRYTVPGLAPCADDEALVSVTLVAAPIAGSNGTLTVCSNASSVDLFLLLGGTPQAGGTWTRPNTTSHSGIYQPGSEMGGTYTYTVQGTSPCAAATASVQITRVIAPNAGTNSSTTVCSTNGSFDLLTVLGGTPNGSGTWQRPIGTTVPSSFVPGTSPAGSYAYLVPGSTPCVNDTAFLNVIVNTAPVAGSNASTTVCSTEAAFNLVDRLNGTPDTGGTWTAPDASPSIGTYTPGVSLTGGYTYVVPGITPCLNATAVLVVNENRQPVAGTNASLARCSTDGPVDLFTILGGTPDPGGSWVGPGGPLSGIFLPGTSPVGSYTYSLTGTAPCVNANATITTVVNVAPNAGTPIGIAACTDQTSVNLFDGLVGNPDANGAWSDDNATGQQSGSFFNLMGMPVGSYSFTYTVLGNGQCGNASSTVVVNIVGQLDAGTNGTTSACRSNTQFNLFAGLGGTPQPGGQWIDLDGTGALFNQFFNASLVPAGTYQFRYRLTGTLSCASDSATTTVTVVAAPNAGVSNAITLCSTPPSTNLFPSLGMGANTGGSWSFGLQGFSGFYDPIINVSGAYVYTVSGSGPCVNATATITVNEINRPNAGTSAVTTVCNNDGPFNMTTRLGGSPQPGSWFFGGTPHSNIFVPGLDSDGIYVYVVTGQTPCNPAQSTLTVTQRAAPNAGNNASITVCSSDGPVALFSFLGAQAQSGGVWSGPTDPFDGIYVPGTTIPGDYFYTVTGLSPCLADVSIVSVFQNTAANAGIPAGITLCASGPTVNLLTVLGGSPDPTGTWTGPAPSTNPFSGVFVPGTTPPGLYTYTVSGAAPCQNRSATVNVAVTTQGTAGCSNAISICSNNLPFAMSSRLLCPPSVFNGTWTGPAPSTAAVDGSFIPGITPPGLYTYTVAGTPNSPCTPSVATLNITQNTAPFAGNDAGINLCSTAGAFNLFTLLGPNAQLGGTWTDPLGATHSGTFLPGMDLPGTYRYTVGGQAPCVIDLALVTVVVNPAPVAGCNGLSVVCTSSTPFALFDLLGCSPTGGGTWIGPSNSSHSGIFLPDSSAPGVYTYTVAGLSPCASASAQVTIIQNQAPDAGQDALRTVCSDQSAINLFNELGGTPGTGGTWRAPNGSLSSATFVPGTSQPGVYTYRLAALAPCVADSATVTVSQNTAVSAGFSTVAFVCSDTVQFPLISLLAGTPDLNGVWRVNNIQRSPIFNPALDGSGTYVYTVTGSAPCPNAVAQVQITRVNAPRAGTGGPIAACLDDPGIQLFQGLSGNYNTDGIWTELNATGQLLGSILNGTGLPAGSYGFTYTVQGSSPCGSASAIVTVNISEALFAGDDAAVSVCESQIVELFPLLGGTPLVGGVWQDLDGSGALLGGGVFNANAVATGSTWNFRYILGGSSQCPSDTALLAITVLVGPNAGCGGSLNLCSTAVPTSMATVLGCTPDNDGFWINSSGQPRPVLFDQLVDAPGIYRYVVQGVGSCPGDTAQVTVQVTTAVNAGSGGPVSICSTDASIDLFNSLGSAAQAGGVWRYNNIIRPNGIYNPASDVPGAYTYTVTATFPCPNETVIVQVAEPIAPNAGSNAAVSVCSTASPFDMRLSLGGGGVAQGGGTWLGPSGTHGNTFNPAEDLSGNYVYTVEGIDPCPDASATLAVVVTQAGNTGQSNTIAACVGQTAVDLFQALGPLATTGGNWTDDSGSGALAGNVFNPAQAGVGQWVFVYTIPVSGPCSVLLSQVTVNVGSGSSAGADNLVEICGANTAFNLFGALGGTPTAGGVWTVLGTGALLPEGIVNASLLASGSTSQFEYTVVDAACGTVSAVVTLTVAPFPVPGIGGPLVLCVTDGPVDLFSQLQGDPQLVGQWYNPQASPHGTTFVPGTDIPGIYRYTISGNAACPDSSAFVNVTVDLPPNAGTNASILACDTISAFDLRGALGGTPESGGTWVSGNWPGAGVDTGFVNTAQASAGQYVFVHTVSNPGCGSAVAQLTLDLVGSVEVMDLQRICNAQDRTYTVSFTITEGNPPTYRVTGVEGSLSSAAPFVFTSVPLFTSESFSFAVSDGFACSEVLLTGQSPCDFDTDVFVPEAFSPNDDGINDAFIIPGIEGYPANSLVIFNRWGARMFEATGYNNSSIVWNGTSSDGSYSGIAPSGTYYYVLDLANDEAPLTGFIYLNR